MQLDGSRFLSRICQALNLDRRESIEDLLRICLRLKDGLDGSRICRESIKQTKSTRNLTRWIKEAVEKLSRRNPEISMDRESIKKLSRPEEESSIERNLLRSCRAWRKKVFSRREKHIEINATYKLLKQTSKSHIKLSTHLSTYKHSIHRSKHTHTHTY